MKSKLARGEYRSAQGMQKDFILIMQNCLQFNAVDSDIVKEARRQALSMPGLLRSAATTHNLFISEDGNVFEIYSDNEKEGDNNDKGGDTDKKKQSNSVKKVRKERKKRGEGSASKAKRSRIERSSPPVKVVRCNECVGCKRDDCGSCLACMDKPKFGGDGSLKQGCYARQCTNMKVAPESDNSSHDCRKDQENDADDNSSERNDDSSSAKKPRIRISLSLNGSKKGKNKSNLDDDKTPKKKSSKKRPRIAQDNEVDDAKQQTMVDKNGDELGNGVPSIPKKRKNMDQDMAEEVPKSNANDDLVKETAEVNVGSGKKLIENSVSTMPKIPKKSDESSKDAKNEIKDGDMSESDESGLIDESNIDKTPSPSRDEIPDDSSTDSYTDLDAIKQERLLLDNNFDVCRNFFTRNGPWKLPKNVAEEKSYDVLRHTLNTMCRHDNYKLFAERVTDKEAPDYSSVVTNPMDFATMRMKITEMTYGTGSEALSAFYHDFLLVMDNCGLYNDKDSDVGKEAGRLMSLLPEVFAASCLAVGDKKRKKKKII